MAQKKLPERWLPYKPLGDRVKGTPFIAFKVPLSKAFNNSVGPDKRFSPDNLLEMCPNLSLVIDLTNTNRYYDKNEFLSKKVYYEKIYCPGHIVPSFQIVKTFFNVVDSFMKQAKPDDLIGVHCTHGVNRTGYFICRYMIQRLGVKPEIAISDFAAARGYPIERLNYVKSLRSLSKAISEPKGHELKLFSFPLHNEIILENVDEGEKVPRPSGNEFARKKKRQKRHHLITGNKKPEHVDRTGDLRISHSYSQSNQQQGSSRKNLYKLSYMNESSGSDSLRYRLNRQNQKSHKSDNLHHPVDHLGRRLTDIDCHHKPNILNQNIGSTQSYKPTGFSFHNNLQERNMCSDRVQQETSNSNPNDWNTVTSRKRTFYSSKK